MAVHTSSAAEAAAPTTRERILIEALNLFAQSGYGGASMRELARRVGIRESSLYNHFAGKAACRVVGAVNIGVDHFLKGIFVFRYNLSRQEISCVVNQYINWSLKHSDKFTKFFRLIFI